MTSQTWVRSCVSCRSGSTWWGVSGRTTSYTTCVCVCGVGGVWKGYRKGMIVWRKVGSGEVDKSNNRNMKEPMWTSKSFPGFSLTVTGWSRATVMYVWDLWVFVGSVRFVGICGICKGFVDFGTGSVSLWVLAGKFGFHALFSGNHRTLSLLIHFFLKCCTCSFSSS